MAIDVETVRIEAQETPVQDGSFEAYEAKRTAEANNEFAAASDDEDESPSSDSQESTESAPVIEGTENQPAAETPESTSEPGTEGNQDDKVKDEKQKGIPQSRLDEVTKARREAERSAEAEKARADKAERELAELKAGKPADTTKPADAAPTTTDTAPAETPKPVAPKRPTLDENDGDWDKYQEALTKFDTELIEHTEKLADWTYANREAAKAKAETERTESARKAKEEADKQAVTTASETEWNERLAAAKAKYPDWDQKMSQDFGGQVYSPAMQSAIRGYADAGDIIYYLANNPEESKRIAAMTPHQDGLPVSKYQELLATAHQELIGIRMKLKGASGTPAAPAATASTPATPPAPKPPETPRPAPNRAPRPISPIDGNAGGGSKDPREAALTGDFSDYERRRRAQQSSRR